MRMLRKLKKYLNSKPIKELQKEWDELESHNFPDSPTVEEFLKQNDIKIKDVIYNMNNIKNPRIDLTKLLQDYDKSRN